MSWAVESQPWQSGDKLMLRIHQDPCARGAVANPGSNPGLMEDCKVLLDLQDELAGTATLNWSVDTAMSSWDGISIGDAPRRVIRVNLEDSSLGGVIPAALGDLTGLQDLCLDGNQLTGEIPPRTRQPDQSLCPVLGPEPVDGRDPAGTWQPAGPGGPVPVQQPAYREHPAGGGEPGGAAAAVDHQQPVHGGAPVS